MKEIKLSQNKVAFVNDEDYEWLNQWRWYTLNLGKTFYARRCKDKVMMHRLIMGVEDKRIVDHADKQGYNNQRYNLRIATKAQNAANSDFNKSNLSSKYRGVYRLKTCDRWEAYIHTDNHKINIGLFKTEAEAAFAYNKAAIKYFGKFASLNKITA